MRTGLFTLVVVVVAAVACSFPDGIVVVVTADASSSSSSSTGSSTRKNPELTFGMTATQNQLGSATTKTGIIKAFLDVSFVPTIKWTHSGNVAGYCDYAVRTTRLPGMCDVVRNVASESMTYPFIESRLVSHARAN